MKIRVIAPFLLCVLLVTACSSGASPSSSANGAARQPVSKQSDPAKPAFAGLHRDQSPPYSSTFVVQFEGPTHWSYQLKTRKSETLREMSLHIDGIKGNNNPGDIRLVTDGKTSWVTGAGTDQECVQYPNNQGMDPKMLYPESLLSEQDLNGMLVYAGEEQMNGAASLHYSGSAPAASGWKDVQVDTWQDKASGALLRFTMTANGEDQIFATGAGKLTAKYEAGALDVAKIAPVKGCGVSVPLPKTAQNFVRLPGMASFDSPAGIEEIRGFYQDQLPQGGWSVKDVPSISPDSIVLSYARDADVVEIHIETDPAGGSKIKLLFMKNQ